MSNYVGADLSFAKTGLAVISVKDRKPTIKLAYLIVSDTKKSATERIDATVTEIKYVAAKVDAEVLAKEASIIRQVSTATEVSEGWWGDGDIRKRALTRAGFNYDVVQAEVNRQVAKDDEEYVKRKVWRSIE